MILGFGILGASSADAQSVLYSQPYDGVSVYASFVRSGSGSDSSCFDDFTLSGGGTITDLNWTGFAYPNQTINGFTVSFWSYAAGRAGSLLASDSLDLTSVRATPESGFIFNYSAAVAPFSAAAGTGYFLSIVANVPDGSWSWGTSSIGNHGAYSVSLFETQITDNGLAFTLEGTAVPEPDTSVLGLMSAAALLFHRRK